MSSAVGDLVATLRVDHEDFSQGLRESTEQLEQFGEHSEMHVGGASRAFNFLGREIKEAGEHLGETNASLGGAVEGLGGLTTGIGEAVHGFHALHTVIEMATVAQVALDAVTPLGWATLIAGAAAGAAAYIGLRNSAADAHEELKKIESLHGAAFDEAAARKRTELQQQVNEAQQTHNAGTYEMVGMAAGPMGMAAGYLYEEKCINDAKSALDEFNKLAAEHVRAEGQKEVADSMAHLREEAEKCKPPLEQIQDSLKKMGAGADEIARTTSEFKKLHQEMDAHKAEHTVAEDEFNESIKGLSPGEQHNKRFLHENPNATDDERKREFNLGNKMDEDVRNKHEQEGKEHAQADQARDDKQLQSMVGGLLEGPGDKFVQEINRIRDGVSRGVLTEGQGHAAEAKIQQQMQEQIQRDTPKVEAPKAEEKDSDAAWKSILDAMNNPGANDPAQKTADSCARMAATLDAIKNQPSGEITFHS